MRDEAPQQSTSSRGLVLRDFGGQDNSSPSALSDDSFYTLLNLRPTRGALTQTNLVATLIAEIAT